MKIHINTSWALFYKLSIIIPWCVLQFYPEILNISKIVGDSYLQKYLLLSLGFLSFNVSTSKWSFRIFILKSWRDENYDFEPGLINAILQLQIYLFLFEKRAKKSTLNLAKFLKRQKIIKRCFLTKTCPVTNDSFCGLGLDDNRYF